MKNIHHSIRHRLITMESQMTRCKIVVVGDTQCGKTALLHVFAKDSYPENYVATVFENYTASFEIEKQRIELNMWDTSGNLHRGGSKVVQMLLLLTHTGINECTLQQLLSHYLINGRHDESQISVSEKTLFYYTKEQANKEIKYSVQVQTLRSFDHLQCCAKQVRNTWVFKESAHLHNVEGKVGSPRKMKGFTRKRKKTFLSYPESEKKREEGRPRNLDLFLPADEPSSACIVEDTEQLEESAQVRSAYYDNVRPLAYPDSDAVLICFDVSRPETLDSVLKKWQSETQEFCPNAKVVLVGCKLDMRTDLNTLLELSKQRLIPVTHEQGSTLARQIGAVAYMECSSKVSENSVRDVFHVTTLASVNKMHKHLKRSNSKRGLKRVSQMPGRTDLLENTEMRKDRAKSCSIM
ncbi:RND2 protein, partial [Polyodon spathula]|nr:RND2 protein [Polyodon spathula]